MAGILRRSLLLALPAVLAASRARAFTLGEGALWAGLVLLRADGSRVRAGLAPVTAIALWSSECVACRGELPALRALADRYGEGGLAVHLVSHPDCWAQDRAAARSLGVADLACTVAPGQSSRLVADAFGMRDGTMAVPQGFLIAGRRLLEAGLGGLDWDGPALRRRVERALLSS